MKTQISPANRQSLAFTLVELLVVMAVIALLAAMIFPAAAAIKKRAIIKRVETEMKLVEVALAAYQGNLGHYPPDNPGGAATNQLFYELIGTKLVNGPAYETEIGQGRISTTDVATFFGNGVSGFVNVSKGGGDENQSAKNYLVGLKPTQFLEVERSGVRGIVLGVSDKGPIVIDETGAGGRTINPWRYRSGSATNNPGKYDLWIDVLIGGKTNRFCNWSEKPLLVNDY